GHCYPEFYLEDKEGKGYWFPCQAAGTRDFGGISEFRPILQKGDNFQVPERKDRQRYIAEHLTGAGGRPSVEFIRTAVAEKP
ncbi:MAG TPA: transglutaminase domain-containing protein, partial [Pirellulales bacterium]|nr:transglutaminase domain-containing protein [Pirellulales bacterium]